MTTPSMRPLTGGFTNHGEYADVAVVVVTFNSEKDVPRLLASLRNEARQQTLKVVVADNSPTPLTLRALADVPDVLAFSTGGNLGYAGAINAAMRLAGDAGTYLVLNPDLRVEPGAVQTLRSRMESEGAGVVVPLLLDEDGSTYHSLRREPTVSRAIGDALLGAKVRSRPAWLSETDFDPDSYRRPHKVDWATGAALLIRRDIPKLVGEWDENYFLYSEETDYMHRVREAGVEVWFEPAASVTHSGGGSGSSLALDALLATNRIRYIRKFRSAGYAQAFRAAVVLSALLRAPLPGRGRVLAAVARERHWTRLPQATPNEDVCFPSDFPSGSLIIPAHNESAVIGRTLSTLAAVVATGSVEVIVSCNGCTDDTAAIARTFPGIRVIEVGEASKTAALNAGDQAATLWPRVYLDADIELPPDSLRLTLEALAAEDGPLAARPAFLYDTQGASWLVRAYYRARNRLPQASESMWGAGVYGLSQRGHERLVSFPNVTGDDCFVDRLFTDQEKCTLEGPPVTVWTPRSARPLLAILKRVYRGNGELRRVAGSHTPRTVRELCVSVHGPASAIDAAVYIAFAVAGRLGRQQGRGPGHSWERDESSRH